MNDNLLISVGVLSTYWEKSKKDTIDLLLPFLETSIAATSKEGEVIDVGKVREYFRHEFGYVDITDQVIVLMLNRLSPGKVRKTHGQFVLLDSFEKESEDFLKKQTQYKEHREKVISALFAHLNNRIPSLKLDENQTAENLIAFFAENGIMLVQNADILRGLKYKDNKVKYEIARFILDEESKRSTIFDYLMEMVKGFLVSTAISTQPNNPNTIKAKFKNFHCYLDTRIIINALGLHLIEARQSAQEFLNMLKETGAKVYCFQHNVDEIHDVLHAYKNSLANPKRNYSRTTLEGFDEKGYTIDDVNRYLSVLSNKIESLGITICEDPPMPQDIHSSVWIDEVRLASVLRDSLFYNQASAEKAIENDITSVRSILRLRNGSQVKEIEKSGHIFSSTNSKYCVVVNSFLGITDGVIPPVIPDTNLAAVLWLKRCATHPDYPKIRLIENAMTALEPSQDFLNRFFAVIEKLTFEGGISEDEASIIRTDIFTKREAMKLTQGDPENISGSTVVEIKERLKAQYIGDERAKSDESFNQFMEERNKRNQERARALDSIETTGNDVYNHTIKWTRRLIKGLFWIVLIGAIACLILSITRGSLVSMISSAIIAIFDGIGLVKLFREEWLSMQKCIDRYSRNKANIAMDRKREEYERILGPLI